jgi:hypothetical protein
MADVHGSPGGGQQMPQAANSGSAPVPYAGPDLSPEPPQYAVDLGADAGGATSMVMGGVTDLGTTELAAAHDVSAGLADAPYYPGDISPIYTGGDSDAGGRDSVAGTVAASIAASTARWQELQSDTFSQGSTVGDLISLPANTLDPAVGVTGTAGAYYDPPRDY